MLRISYVLQIKCVILHTQAVPGMSVAGFWEYSVISASVIQISYKGKGMEQGERKPIVALTLLQKRLDRPPVCRTVCEANVYQLLSASLFLVMIPLCRNLGMYKDCDNQHLIAANIVFISRNV